jgi:hypothetical protein
MATITPTLSINPQTMTSNWTKGVQQSGQKWLAKYLAPRRAFNADPTGSQTAWQNGINAAIARNAYANGLANADLTMAANNATNFGQTNYVAAGTNHAAKYAAKANNLATALSTVRAQVEAMPKSTPADRINRMVAWATGMAAYKGKI